MKQGREITGWHVAIGFGLAFSIIIGVNLTLAFQAVATFPGLETKNSYVASQKFEADRTAQEALGWEIVARVEDGQLRLAFTGADGPVRPEIARAVLGRATHVGEDRVPEFAYDGAAFVAPVDLGPGNWNLRIEVTAPDGTPVRQRLILKVS